VIVYNACVTFDFRNDMDLRKQTEIMVKYMLSTEKESVEDKEIVDSYVDAMMLMYKEYEVSKNESLNLLSSSLDDCCNSEEEDNWDE